ncbi:unnamed protein product [Tilletia laevis]|uniref:Trehalose-phosphatase n=1 Tax=Tilletia caries TaxID=13290 RepID=A0A177UCD7_9BASI|nr:hypothetical protein CF336_g5665 [Tilletia laevis]KAE8253196.1 hypothetical protein A4X03_0g5966 [Tilletia caries]CAD6886627.1 unnamed protein product [Tilletia caries]CAD6925891.1 unnamed protein product [Tilletia caries]CAD6926368.1 unnamed protein product [Tilletia caries]
MTPPAKANNAPAPAPAPAPAAAGSSAAPVGTLPSLSRPAIMFEPSFAGSVLEAAGSLTVPPCDPNAVAHGIGGDGKGTAATGDLGSHTSFLTLAQLRSAISSLTEDYNAKHPHAELSGRIIHVSHFLPFHVRFEDAQERIYPTQPPQQQQQQQQQPKGASDSAVAGDAEEATVQGTAAPHHHHHHRRWALSPRRGHTALNAGIRSLTEAHKQVFVGWPGDLPTCPPPQDSDVPEQQHAEETTAGPSQHPDCRPSELDSDRAQIEDLLSELEAPPVQKSAQQNEQDGQHPTSTIDDAARGIKYVPVWMDYNVAHGHYEGYCKQTLWPLFHYLLWQDVPQPMFSSLKSRQSKPARATHPADQDDKPKPNDHASSTSARTSSTNAHLQQSHADEPCNEHTHVHEAGQERDRMPTEEGGGGGGGGGANELAPELVCRDPPNSTWAYYHAANLAFARRIAEQYQPGDMVWIHDYHLLLVPLMLRKLIPDAPIGLFVHAPFPSSEVFRCLPKRREIIEGMLGSDLACFQAFSYSRHFLSSCIRVCGFEASSNTVESPSGHTTSIQYNPIGIDADRVRRDASAPGVQPKIAAIREMYRGKKIIIGRDKLDVVRGVTQKLQAFYKLLADFPEWRGNVILIQVTAPSSNESRSLERRVSELVSQINGEFGSLSFTPVHHYHQVIEREEYFALLAVADLALITSVRDGMNTTSLEYVIAQEARFQAETAAAAAAAYGEASDSHFTPDPDYTGPSPLILSEFTGTAGRMREAIQVNPWNTSGVAKAIDFGLRLDPAQKRERHARLYTQVTSHTSHTWAAQLVKQLLVRLESGQAAHFTPPLERRRLIDAYISARKRLLLLDYDGTLTPIVKDPEAALPSKELLAALHTLTEDPRNVIFIISGRDERFLSKHLGHLRGIGFSAEHGCFVKEPGSDQWANLTKDLDMGWMAEVKKVFQYYTERTGGSFIEQKKSSITWHYRNADPDFGSFQAKECQAHLENLTTQNELAVEVLVGKKNLEVRPLAVNKGEIVKRILHQHSQEVDFVFCVGDDKTDEDMFRALGSLEPATPLVMAAISAARTGRSRFAKMFNASGGGGSSGGEDDNELDDDVARGVSPIRTGGPNGVPAAIAALASMSPPTYERVEHEEEESAKKAGGGGSVSSSHELSLPLTMSPPAPLGSGSGHKTSGGSGKAAAAGVKATSTSVVPSEAPSSTASSSSISGHSSSSVLDMSASGDETTTTESSATSVSGSTAFAPTDKEKPTLTSADRETDLPSKQAQQKTGSGNRPLILMPELRKKHIFTTMVGPSGKKTLADWHVDGPEMVIDSLIDMAAGRPGADVWEVAAEGGD